MRFLIANNRTDERVGELPFQSSGFGWAIQNYTVQTFTLDPKDKKCPKNWLELIESGVNYIVPVRDGASDSERMTGFFIQSWSETADGMIKVQSSSWERVYENFVVGGPRFDLKDVTSEVFVAIGSTVNQDGVGSNMTFDCAPSGRLINKYISAGERLSPRTVMDDIASDFEWTTDVVWDNAAHTKFRKVTRTGYPHLSTATTTPALAFTRDINGKGNIIDYTFTDSRREGDYATYVVATGDGVADDQIESAPIIDELAERAIELGGEGRMRVQKFENFTGVTTVAEANIMAQRMADNYFAKRNVITLKVSTTGAVKPSMVEKGAFVRLDLWTKAGNRIDEVWRVVALKESSDGTYYEPTLAKVGVKPADFPRPADPTELSRSIRDLYKRSEYSYNRNPSVNGVRMRNARINPDGSIERRTPTGGWEAAGVGGGVSRGIVVSYDAATLTAVVNIGGSSAGTTVTMGEFGSLHAGDIVYVAKNTASTELPVIVASPKVAQPGSGDIFGPYGASTGYPVDASVQQRDLPYGTSFVDTDNAFNFGSDALIIDSDQPNNVWVPSSGLRASITAPGGFRWMPGLLRVTHGQAYSFFSKNGDNNSAVWLFQWDKNTRGWIACSGLPATSDYMNDVFTTGLWTRDSVGSEIFSDPVVPVIKIRQQAFVGNDVSGWAIPLTVIVYHWQPLSASWSTSSYDILSGSGNPGTKPDFNPAAYPTWHWGISNGQHLFFRTGIGAASLNNVYGVRDQFLYVDMQSAAAPVVLSESFQYLGNDYGSIGVYSGATYGTSTIRLSPDGTMYVGTPASRDSNYSGAAVVVDATIKQRPLRSGSIITSTVYPANMDNNMPTNQFMPQRVGTTDRFFIASRIYSVGTNGTKYAFRGALWEHHAGQGTSFQVVPPDGIVTGPANASVSVPQQCSDGSIIANLDTSNAALIGVQSPSHRIHQVVI